MDCTRGRYQPLDEDFLAPDVIDNRNADVGTYYSVSCP